METLSSESSQEMTHRTCLQIPQVIYTLIQELEQTVTLPTRARELLLSDATTVTTLKRANSHKSKSTSSPVSLDYMR